MLLSWQSITLSSQLCQTTADAETSVAWLYYIVDVAILRCLIGVSEQLVVLLLLLGNECLDVLTSFFLGLGLLGIEHCSST